MNERQFLRAVKNKRNKYGMYTYELVHRMIEDYTGETRITRKSQSPKRIIEDNFKHILNKTDDRNISDLLFLIMSYNEEIVINNFDKVLERFKNGPASGIRTNDSAQIDFFNEFVTNKKSEELIQSNIDGILNSISKNNLFRIANIIKGYSKYTDNKINNFLEQNKVEVAKYLLKKYTKVSVLEQLNRGNFEDLANEYAITLSIMIDELLENEKCRWIDIKNIGSGAYSNVYEIGTKVLKIGGPRQTYKIPNHTRILQPLTRTNLINEIDNSVFLCIEIADKIDKLEGEDFTEESLYEIYKELRESGIIWTDIRRENLGKLKNKNSPYKSMNSEIINVAPNSVGFIDEMKGMETNKNDIVILDTDYIYKEDDPNIVWPSNMFVNEFEARWQQEQQVRIQKKIAKHVNDFSEEENIKEKGEDDER